jgi:hypothetical protein
MNPKLTLDRYKSGHISAESRMCFKLSLFERTRSSRESHFKMERINPTSSDVFL